MFTKSTLVKFVLAPLAAVTLLAQATAASPAAVALKVREDDGLALRSPYWPRWSGGDGDGDCRTDCDRLPKIVKPNRDTVWRVGEREQVVWEKKRPRDDRKDDDDKDKNRGKDDKGKQDDKDGKDKDKKGGNDHRKPRCKAKLTLRKGRDFRPVVLAENFDIDAGSVGVTVPDVPPGDDYTVTLSLGKLESTSDRFKIVKKRGDCKGWWCKDDDKDHHRDDKDHHRDDKDNHRDDKDHHRDDKDHHRDDKHDKDGKDGKGRHDDKDCKDWWCKDHGKDGKDHHDDKDRKDGKGRDGKDGKGRDGKDGKHGHDDDRGKDGKEKHGKDDNKHY